MKIAIINNEYQQPGGEAQVARNESAMLSARGHTVQSIVVSNKEIINLWSRFKTACDATYSRASKSRIRLELEAFRPDLVHVHNFFPLITPSVYDACRELDVPVVQSLHNFRIICPGALLMRGAKICERCLNASSYRSIVHRCYRRSILGTLAASMMVEHHRRRGTWREKVDRFIALTEFAKAKFVEGGLPEGKITVKPNFVKQDPGMGKGEGGYGLFVGRLSAEKGLRVLLKAWERLGDRVLLRIVGDGPLAEEIKHASERSPGVQYLGYKPWEDVASLMKEASFLLLPSTCYEGLPLTLLEAYAAGLPVVGSDLGPLAAVILDGRTGLRFCPGNHEALAEKVEWLLLHPEDLRGMREASRAEYLEKYSEQRNYEMLMAVYRRVKGLGGGEGSVWQTSNSQ